MEQLEQTFRLDRRSLFCLAAGLLGAAPVRAEAQDANWKPARPINLIVPWAAGGSTDSVTRVVASELEKPLGQTIVIINQPGASGAIGTNSCLNAARDGYTARDNERASWYAQADKPRTQAALAWSSGGIRSGLNPSVFSDTLSEMPQT